MILSLIAAVSDNDVIGRAGALPWKLPNDLRRFKELTMGKPIIMGRKTFDSIGRPLPGRRNIVISRQEHVPPGCELVHSLEEALALPSDVPEVFVIGGGEIYKQAMPRANRLYLTRVHTIADGDAFFPGIERGGWNEISREDHPSDERHAHAYTFFLYERNPLAS